MYSSIYIDYSILVSTYKSFCLSQSPFHYIYILQSPLLSLHITLILHRHIYPLHLSPHLRYLPHLHPHLSRNLALPNLSRSRLPLLYYRHTIHLVNITQYVRNPSAADNVPFHGEPISPTAPIWPNTLSLSPLPPPHLRLSSPSPCPSTNTTSLTADDVSDHGGLLRLSPSVPGQQSSQTRRRRRS